MVLLKRRSKASMELLASAAEQACIASIAHQSVLENYAMPSFLSQVSATPSVID
jgi:hypothetical protein